MNSKYYIPVANANEIKLNKLLRVFYLNQTVVLLRTTQGLHAYEDYCPHRGLALSEGVLIAGQIQCKYHGWRFKAEDGTNTFVPVKNDSVSCQLKSFYVKEMHDLIWLSNANDAILPSLSSINPTLTLSGSIKANRLNTLENFLEGSHTHFVHDGLVRTEQNKRNAIHAHILNNENGFKVRYASEPAKGFLTKMLPKRFQQLYAVSTYIHPNIAILEYYNGQEQLISRFEAILIEEDQQIKYFARIILNVGWITPLITPFAKQLFKKVIDQDKHILELQEQNLKQFKNHTFISDETDIVGKYLYAWSKEQQQQLKSENHFNVFW